MYFIKGLYRYWDKMWNILDFSLENIFTFRARWENRILVSVNYSALPSGRHQGLIELQFCNWNSIKENCRDLIRPEIAIQAERDLDPICDLVTWHEFKKKCYMCHSVTSMWCDPVLGVRQTGNDFISVQISPPILCSVFVL